MVVVAFKGADDIGDGKEINKRRIDDLSSNAIRSHDVPRVITTTLSSPVSAAAKKLSLGPIAASIDSRDDAASARIYSDGPSAALRSVETASDRTQSEMESTSTSVLTHSQNSWASYSVPPDRSGHSVSSGQISFLKKDKEKRFPLPRVHNASSTKDRHIPLRSYVRSRNRHIQSIAFSNGGSTCDSSVAPSSRQAASSCEDGENSILSASEDLEGSMALSLGTYEYSQGGAGSLNTESDTAAWGCQVFGADLEPVRESDNSTCAGNDEDCDNHYDGASFEAYQSGKKTTRKQKVSRIQTQLTAAGTDRLRYAAVNNCKGRMYNLEDAKTPKVNNKTLGTNSKFSRGKLLANPASSSTPAKYESQLCPICSSKFIYLQRNENRHTNDNSSRGVNSIIDCIDQAADDADKCLSECRPPTLLSSLTCGFGEWFSVVNENKPTNGRKKMPQRRMEMRNRRNGSVPPYCVGCQAYIVSAAMHESKREQLLSNLSKWVAETPDVYAFNHLDAVAVTNELGNDCVRATRPLKGKIIIVSDECDDLTGQHEIIETIYGGGSRDGSGTTEQQQKDSPIFLSDTETREVVTRVIRSKLLSGYLITNHRCGVCDMPLMEKDQTHVCVVCPVVRGEIKTSGKEIRQEPEPEVKPGKFLIADEGLRTEKLLFADPRTLPHVAYSEKLNNESNQGKIMMATNKDTLFKVIEAPVASFFAEQKDVSNLLLRGWHLLDEEHACKSCNYPTVSEKAGSEALCVKATCRSSFARAQEDTLLSNCSSESLDGFEDDPEIIALQNNLLNGKSQAEDYQKTIRKRGQQRVQDHVEGKCSTNYEDMSAFKSASSHDSMELLVQNMQRAKVQLLRRVEQRSEDDTAIEISPELGMAELIERLATAAKEVDDLDSCIRKQEG